MKQFTSFIRVLVLSAVFYLTSSMAGTDALAGRSWIFGMDSADVAVSVPSQMCVYLGQTIRFRPDVIDNQGNRMQLPLNSFIWRYTRSNGMWNQWDSRFASFFYPFRFNNARDSVLVEVTPDLGLQGRLEMVAPGHAATSLFLVDAERVRNLADCSWGPSSIYVTGRRPPNERPIVPPDDNILTCQDVCLVGAKCGDRCPSMASCEVNLDKDGNIRYHKVLACH